jgi:hypothetical protein
VVHGGSDMKITDQAVTYVADLTRLSFSLDQHVERVVQLNRILKYFESLTEVETAGVEPLMHDLHPVGALLCCAHCHERQTEWHLHRPSLQ